MSHSLICVFPVVPAYPQHYWWPLVIEALGREQCYFAHPARHQREGSFFWFHETAEKETHVRATGTFRSLWDNISQAGIGDTFIVDFSAVEADSGMRMNVLLFGEEETKDGLIHEIHIEGPLVMTGQSPAVVKKHLQRFLACAQTIYETCQPLSGEIYWFWSGEEYTPWATFDKPMPEPSDDRPEYGGPSGQIIQQPFAERHICSCLDPVPIPHKHSWAFLSLQPEAPVEYIW